MGTSLPIKNLQIKKELLFYERGIKIMVWIVKPNNRMEQIRGKLYGLLLRSRERPLTEEEKEEQTRLHKELFQLKREAGDDPLAFLLQQTQNSKKQDKD